jgi:molecular chaperone DnaJ
MNLREAYSTLELSEGTSLSDAKKKYRELSKKYHPDVNKDPGSEDNLKKLMRLIIGSKKEKMTL